MRNPESGRASRGNNHTHDTDKRRITNTRKDYWDKVADDVASGYGARQSHKTVRNRDQQPNDNRRGDEA